MNTLIVVKFLYPKLTKLMENSIIAYEKLLNEISVAKILWEKTYL